MDDGSTKQSSFYKFIYFSKMNMFNVFYEIMKDAKISNIKRQMDCNNSDHNFIFPICRPSF